MTIETMPAKDVIIMDEGHYFNEPSQGHIWEQSIIGLHLNVTDHTLGDDRYSSEFLSVDLYNPRDKNGAGPRH